MSVLCAWGGTCTGKSNLIEHLSDAKDMDKLVFPLLTQEEADYVCQTPWTPEIGETMTRLTKERVKVKPGEPVFGTVVLDADRVVHLKISDDLLRERTTARGVSFLTKVEIFFLMAYTQITKATIS